MLKKSNKIKILTVMVLMLLISVLGLFSFAGAEQITLSDLTVTMQSDAKPYFNEEDGKIGMQFTMEMSNEQYDLLNSQIGQDKSFVDAEYGVVILPKYYTDTYAVNENTLFGNTAVYDYATYDGNDYVYSGNKIRVININANDWENKGDKYTYSGAIVDILDQNLALEMYAVGYIKLTDTAGLSQYKFTEGVVSSACYTAQKVIESGEYTAEENATLKQTYIDAVSEKFTYTTNYYVKTDNGYSLINSTVSSQYALNSSVDADVLDLTSKGYFFDSLNELNVLSGKVYANDKLALSVYYTVGENGLIDVSKTKNMDLESFATFDNQITTKKLYRVVGDKEYQVTYSPKSGLTDLTALDKGTYRFSAGYTDTDYVEKISVSFDLYDGTELPVYTDVSITTKRYGEAAARHVATRPFVIGWGVDWTLKSASTVPDGAPNTFDTFFYTTTDRYNGSDYLTYAVQRLYIRPIHSKAYYQKLLDENYVLKFDYYFENADLSDTRNVAINDGEYQVRSLNTWHQAEITLDKLYENWDYITKPGSNTTGDVGALLNIEANVSNALAYNIYIGNIRFADTRIANDTDEKIVDVKGATYDLINATPNAVKTAIANATQTVSYVLTDNKDSKITFTDSVVTFGSDLEYGRYTLDVKIGSTVIYTGKFDFYSSTAYEWNIPNADDLVVKHTTYSVHDSNILGDKQYSIIDASTVSSSSVLYGKTGSYVKMTSTASENIVFNLMPKHLMDCYSGLFKKGYVLTFDYYTTSSAVGRYVGTAHYENAFKTWRGGLNSNKWGVVSISFDNFLLQKDKTNTGYFMDWTSVGLSDKVNNRMFVAEMMTAGDLYIGNFRIEQMPDVIAYNSTATDVDVGGKPTVDLLNALSDWQIEKYNLYNELYDVIQWTVTFANGESVTLDAGETTLNTIDYIAKFNLGSVAIVGRTAGTCPDGIRRAYKVINLENRTFANFSSDVDATIATTDSNTEILQNVDHFANGDLTANSTLNIVVARNETESAQIIFKSNDDIGYYDLGMTDLRNGSNYLYSSNFKAYHEYYVEIKKSTGMYFPYSTGMYPDALIPLDNAIDKGINAVTSGDNQGVWIQFTIPKNQPAGEYVGTFTLQLENSYFSIPVSVTVVDYTLSDDQHLTTRFGLNLTNISALEDLSIYTEDELKSFVDEYYYEGLLDYGINLGSFFTHNEERWAGTYWIGRPYNPDALFSFDEIYIDGGYHYQYEYPLVSLGDNDELVVWTGGFKNGYGYNETKVNEWVSQALKYANNPSVLSYQLPVITGASVKFTSESLSALFPSDGLGYGNYTEVRNTLDNAYRINSVNLLTTRDVYEQIFLSSISNGVDLFKKGELFYSWFDEYSNNDSKLKVAQIITEIMKDYFPDLANWLKVKHNVTDTFALSVLDSISKIQIVATGENTYDFDPETQWLAHCPGDGQYQTEKRRKEILEWAKSVYNGEGKVWTYNGGYKVEDPMTTIKSRGWWMYDYDVEADLQWAIMSAQYLDGISDTLVGKDVTDGEYIDPEDFYDIAVHYGGVTGIGYMIYPGTPMGVKGFVPSIRLDSYRDSVEDYNLLYSLERYYEQRAKDKGVTYNSTDFDGIMDRLTENMYNGVKYKIHDGYQEDFNQSRTSLLNMLVLADKYDIVIEKCVLNGDVITFYVSAPKTLNLAGYQTETTTGNYKTYTFLAGDKDFDFTFEGVNVKLSVEVYRETADIAHLVWTDGENDTYKTYTEKVVNSTTSPMNVELVQLNAAVTVGGLSEGQYYRVTPANEADYKKHLGFTLFPDYDKTYYEENASITTLKFDVFIQLTTADGSHPDDYRLFFYLGYSQNTQQLANEWFTVEIPMTEVINQWDDLVATKNATSYRITDGNLFTIQGNYFDRDELTEFYIGNFRIEHN